MVTIAILLWSLLLLRAKASGPPRWFNTSTPGGGPSNRTSTDLLSTSTIIVDSTTRSISRAANELPVVLPSSSNSTGTAYSMTTTSVIEMSMASSEQLNISSTSQTKNDTSLITVQPVYPQDGPGDSYALSVSGRQNITSASYPVLTAQRNRISWVTAATTPRNVDQQCVSSGCSSAGLSQSPVSASLASGTPQYGSRMLRGSSMRQWRNTTNECQAEWLQWSSTSESIWSAHGGWSTLTVGSDMTLATDFGSADVYTTLEGFAHAHGSFTITMIETHTYPVARDTWSLWFPPDLATSISYPRYPDCTIYSDECASMWSSFNQIYIITSSPVTITDTDGWIGPSVTWEWSDRDRESPRCDQVLATETIKFDPDPKFTYGPPADICEQSNSTGQCSISGKNVKLYYWRTATKTSLDASRRVTHSPALRTTIVQGITMTSPTVYMSFDTLKAFYDVRYQGICSGRDWVYGEIFTLGREVTASWFSIDPDLISTLEWKSRNDNGPEAVFSVLQDTVRYDRRAAIAALWPSNVFELFVTTSKLNFEHLTRPDPRAYYFGLRQADTWFSIHDDEYYASTDIQARNSMPIGCWDMQAYCNTIFDDLYMPQLSIPTEVRELDPLWSTCGHELWGIYDPPFALDEESEQEIDQPVTTGGIELVLQTAAPQLTTSVAPQTSWETRFYPSMVPSAPAPEPEKQSSDIREPLVSHSQQTDAVYTVLVHIPSVQTTQQTATSPSPKLAGLWFPGITIKLPCYPLIVGICPEPPSSNVRETGVPQMDTTGDKSTSALTILDEEASGQAAPGDINASNTDWSFTSRPRQAINTANHPTKTRSDALDTVHDAEDVLAQYLDLDLTERMKATLDVHDSYKAVSKASTRHEENAEAAVPPQHTTGLIKGDAAAQLGVDYALMEAVQITAGVRLTTIDGRTLVAQGVDLRTIMVDGTILLPGQRMTVSGQFISVGSFAIIVGTKLIPLPTVSAVATIAGHTIRLASVQAPQLFMDGTALPSGAQFTMAGTVVSVGEHMLVVGSKTISLHAPEAIATIAGHTFFANRLADEAIEVDGSTYSPGQALTVDGTVVSIQSNAIVVGSTTIPLSTSNIGLPHRTRHPMAPVPTMAAPDVILSAGCSKVPRAVTLPSVTIVLALLLTLRWF